MNNYKLLKEIEENTKQLQKEKEALKEKHFNDYSNYRDYMEKLTTIDNKLQYEDIKYNIVKNNLYLDAHNKLMQVYKSIYTKYENKNIGDKRKEEIRELLNKQLEEVFAYTENEPYWNRFLLYFHIETDFTGQKRYFNITIDKLKYDFTYYVENEEIKTKYNYVEKMQYIDNIEEEAKRLQKLYNETLTKKEEIEKELENIKKEISDNFKKNLHTEDISRLTRKLTLQWN